VLALLLGGVVALWSGAAAVVLVPVELALLEGAVAV
jgi:hypothetical protein